MIMTTANVGVCFGGFYCNCRQRLQMSNKDDTVHLLVYFASFLLDEISVKIE